VFFVRAGKLLGNRIIDAGGQAGFEVKELLAEVMTRFYDANLIPSAIYCREEPESCSSLLSLLSEQSGRQVRFHRPQRGQYLKLLKMADANALEVLRNLKSDSHERVDTAVIDLQRQLSLSKPPFRIECVDISHIQGTDPVASLVVFKNARPHKGEYRLFHIKSAQGGDDPASIAEVTRRRFTRLLHEQATMPDLYIVDGGITQVRSALRELDELGLTIETFGLAKREETLVRPDGTEFKLPFSSPGMQMVVKLRNEAHRFANTFQKKTHGRTVLRSALLNLPGVGPATLRKAIMEFGSTARLAEISAEELQKRCQIPLKTAELIIASLKESQK
jgi:excinuclease ABC subunit C